MPSQLTDTHRRQQLALRAATVRDLTRLWPSLDWARLDDSYPVFALQVAALVGERRAMSASLAARYMRALRASNRVPGEFAPVVAGAVDPARLETSLRVTAVAGVKTAVSRGVPPQRAMLTAFTRAAGAVGRHVLDAGRDTVRDSIRADPRAVGWRRVTTGRGCGFCRMLAGRGAVYSAETARFSSHDHCGCTVEPVWGSPDKIPVLPYTPSQRRRSDETKAEDNARAYAFIAANEI